jgi:hypothetical protein
MDSGRRSALGSPMPTKVDICTHLTVQIITALEKSLWALPSQLGYADAQEDTSTSYQSDQYY